jgi:hypothetical protein
VADDKDHTERAKELFVYGPIGLALYLRDTAPSFLKLFVARGRAELGSQRKTVGDQLGQARAVGEFASAYGGSQAKNLLVDGFARVKARAEETLGALGVLTPDADTRTEADEEAVASPAAPPAGESPTEVQATTEVPGPAATPLVTETPAPGPAAAKPAEGGLAIPEYDELSASQVVDRLEGLSDVDLDAIRRYELANRARNTILGKIDQLTRRS